MDGKELLKLSTPLISMGTVWVANKAIAIAYEKATGDPIPRADDTEISMARVILFTAATAVVGAVITAGVTRGIARAATTEPGAEELAPAS